MSFAPNKTFLNYLDLKLLGRFVNSLGLVIIEDKLKTIVKLYYPNIFGEFEYYLKLINYIRF